MAAKKNTIANFWSKVDKDGPVLLHVEHLGACWMWTAGRFGRGYGAFSLDGRLQRAHRVIWTMLFGPIPEATPLVCHRCDNPSCVNPDHLFLDTSCGNNRDMVAKGRHRCGKGERHNSKIRPENVARGERAGGAKLSECDVRDIRRRVESGEPPTAVARSYSVTHGAVSLIVSRRNWRHVK